MLSKFNKDDVNYFLIKVNTSIHQYQLYQNFIKDDVNYFFIKVNTSISMLSKFHKR
jgi:hypothetical protein